MNDDEWVTEEAMCAFDAAIGVVTEAIELKGINYVLILSLEGQDPVTEVNIVADIHEKGRIGQVLKVAQNRVAEVEKPTPPVDKP